MKKRERLPVFDVRRVRQVYERSKRPDKNRAFGNTERLRLGDQVAACHRAIVDGFVSPAQAFWPEKPFSAPPRSAGA